MKKKLLTLFLLTTVFGSITQFNPKNTVEMQQTNVYKPFKKKKQCLLFNEKKASYFTLQEYTNYNKNDILQYLYNGGIIINDKIIEADIYKEIFDIDTFTYNYNSYAFFNGVSFDVTFFTVGYLNSNNKIELSYDNYEQYVDDIVCEVNKKMQNDYAAMTSDSSSTQIYNDSIQHIVYKDNSTSKLCTYTISIKINRTSLDSNVGTYTAISSITITPESKYSIKNYSINIGLNSNLNISSYNYIADGSEQTIEENRINDREIKVNSNIKSSQYDVEMSLSEVISFKSINELNTSSFWTSLSSLELKDNGWWMFQKNYSITNENKKKLQVNWNKDGFLSQNISSL